ncbi:hypothetical protein J22TS1_48330 [Siminovitchia terrae]|nr:hypothetical protein J22TS1_48330 [Siminovitchia terrae]
MKSGGSFTDGPKFFSPREFLLDQTSYFVVGTPVGIVSGVISDIVIANK